MDTRELVSDLGGLSVVADELGCVVSAVSNWHRQGIPPRHWPKLIRMAEARNVAGVTLEALEALNAAHKQSERAA
jgi:hypothetical protein